MAAVYIAGWIQAERRDRNLSMNRQTPRPRFDWQLRSRKLTLGIRTLVMAIVNITPESLLKADDTSLIVPSQPGMGAACARLSFAAAVEAVDNGADIIDLSAQSTRPNAMPISAEEELAMLLPVLQPLLAAKPGTIVSVDTYHSATARVAASLGAEIIHDVSGLGWDPAMADVVARSGCGLVLMHTRSRTRQWLAEGAMSSDEVVPAIFSGLCEGVALAEAAGIDTERIVVDPGFGFGKRGSENFALLAQLNRLNQLGRPLLVGLSRKRFLGEAVRGVQTEGLTKAEARRTATIAGNAAAVLAGTHILRVHDVQAAKEAAAIADAVLLAS
jgi:dihydropteroate synthase